MGRLGRGLGPLLGAFEPSLDGLGRVLDRLEGVFGGGFIVVLEFIDSIHRFDFLMRFVDSIRWFDSLIRLLDSNQIGRMPRVVCSFCVFGGAHFVQEWKGK